jgi:hypothetical protein
MTYTTAGVVGCLVPFLTPTRGTKAFSVLAAKVLYIMPKPTLRRACRDYERLWRGRCVDRNLADEWLERLNDLRSCRLISICEGHLRAGRRATGPHINLRLKPGFVSVAFDTWDSLSIELATRLPTLFDSADTIVAANLHLEVRLVRDAVQQRRDCVIRINSRRARTTEDMDAETADWFQRSVLASESLDEFLLDRLGDHAKVGLTA